MQYEEEELMKKKLIVLLSVLALSCTLTACSFSLDGLLGSDFGDTSDTVSDTGVGNGQDQHVYTAFTPAEEALIYQKVNGAQIPFLPNDEYYVEEYDEVTSTLHKYGVHFYTYGNTQAEYDAYKARFNGYVIKTDYQDENGREWYFFEHERGWGVEMTYYTNADGKSVVSVHIYLSDAVPDPIQPDFTAEEKALFNEYFGFVIPFVASDEYYVEDYTEEYTGLYDAYVNFYTLGSTQAEFNAYKAAFEPNGFKFVEEYKDDYGDTCYLYSKGDVYVDMSYYLYDGEYFIDVYVYIESTGGGSGGNQGGSGDQGGGSTENSDLITNAGKGLPTDADGDGVHNVDFTKATYVKNVTEQGYYVDGCPTTGSPKVLVIPVEFSD